MINHVRTLLLNNPPIHGQIVGDEYIPADFVPIVVSSTIAKVRMGLFGARPQRRTMNYRMWQLMSLLHATELKQFMLEHDQRITYDPGGPSPFDAVMDMPSLPEVVEQLEQLLAPSDCDVLFSDEEPYLTFRNLWKDHDQIAYRLGGLLLAVAYRTHAIGAS